MKTNELLAAFAVTSGLALVTIITGSVLSQRRGNAVDNPYPPAPPTPPEPPIQLKGRTPFDSFVDAYLDLDRLTQREFAALVSKYPSDYVLIENLRAAYEDDFINPEEDQKITPQLFDSDHHANRTNFKKLARFPWVSQHDRNVFSDHPELWDQAVPILKGAKNSGILDQLPPPVKAFIENELIERVNLAARDPNDEIAVNALMSHVEGLSLFFSKTPSDGELLSKLLPFKYYNASENNGRPWTALPQLGCELKKAFGQLATSHGYQYAAEMRSRVERGAALFCD
ncbi:MAG: hypothetical protein HYY44_01810 [Deltaproteobacteria bacterium]|nr:hypothetical protein [Deltaproteobacteria bacterium]